MRKISRLVGNRVYLAGPIDRCPNDGRAWRDKVTPTLHGMGLVVLDPLNKPIDAAPEDPDSRAERRRWKTDGEYGKFSKFMKEIVAIDLRLINTCDFVIALIDMDIFACGTLEEIFRANDQKKPVLVWCPQGKKSIPDWLFGKLPHELFFNSVEEILTYLDDVAFSDVPPVHHNRWLFMDIGGLYPDHTVGLIKQATSGVI